jgi:hypothetical protein
MKNVDLTRERILGLFEKLDAKMFEVGIEATAFVVGGAAIALSVNDLRVTTDIDAKYEQPALDALIQSVAHEEDLPPDWLNNTIHATLVYFKDDASPKTVFNGKMLSIQTASPEYLLAMKLAARRPKDEDDILLLAKTLGLKTKDDIIAVADKYFKADLSASAWQRTQMEEFLDTLGMEAKADEK